MNTLEGLAFIILNYNSYDDTASCVDRLISFDAGYHLIVVDNCSPDGSGSRLSERYRGSDKVDVVIIPDNGGYGAGNNAGIRYAEEKYDIDTIAVINPDVEIPDLNVIRSMHDMLWSDDSFGITAAKIVDKDGSYNLNHSTWNIENARGFALRQSLFTRRYSKPYRCIPVNEYADETDCVAGCFFMARLRCFRDIGYFDENIFLYNEEDVLGIKCKAGGYRTIFLHDVSYYHNHKDSERNVSFHEKVHATEASYRSAKYVLKKYYRGQGQMLLWTVEAVNRVYLAACYVKNRLTGAR